jgi:hypothetical protein
MRTIQIFFIADPHIALLDLLNEDLGIEFPEACGNLERLRGLRLVPDMLRRDDSPVLALYSQRKFSHRIDPAEEFPPRGCNGPVGDGTLPVDRFLAGALAAPILPIRNTGHSCHRLPLPAWRLRIDRHENLREAGRLPGFHEYPCGGPHEKSGRLCGVDQEEAVGKFRRFNSYLVVIDAQLATSAAASSPLVVTRSAENCCACAGARPHSKTPARASKTNRIRLDGKTFIELLAIINIR